MVTSVLIVLKHFNFGGTERYAINLANALIEKGISVVMVGGHGPLSKYISPKVKTFFAPIGRERKHKNKSEKIIASLCTTYNVQVIYAQCRNSLICCQLARKHLNIPVISHEHLAYKESEYPFVVDELKNNTDKLITLGPYSTKKLVAYGFEKKKIKTILNGVNLKEFPIITPEEKKIARQSLKLLPTDKVILCLSRIVPGKKIEKLLDAFVIVAKEIPQAKLVIAGNDEWKSTKPFIRSQIKKYNLGKRVLLFPAQFDIRKFHAASDVFCYPPISKGMAVLEAMASSLPIVAQRAIRKPFVVEDSISGLLTTTDSVNELAEKLQFLLKHPRISKKMGTAARQQIEEKFNLRDLLGSILKTYKEVVNSHASNTRIDSNGITHPFYSLDNESFGVATA